MKKRFEVDVVKRMSEKRFEVSFDEKRIIDIYAVNKNTTEYDIHKSCDLINSLYEENEQLKRRLEKINGGYGNLTHYKGLTANEWLIQGQERELKKKDKQISEWIEQHSKDIVKIGEQNKLIQNLKEENDKLKELIKGNVFGKYREGSLADLEFKAIAYDDIVKLEMSYESEPKLMVYCNYGKRENIMSFCQMFIPFGVAYEIKEVIDNE